MKVFASLLASLVTILGLVSADCDSPMDEATFGDFRTCSRSQVKESLGHQASCSPRAVVMRLPWPNSTMVGGGVQQMTPTHVTVMQCGGGCHRGSQGCIATSTRTREVSVMVGKCGVSVGKCEKECATVTLEEHTKCGCGCQLDRVDCELDGLHRFKEELCQCECKDIEAKRSCLEQGRTWEEDSCTCGCPALKSCAVGDVYSATTCMCEPSEIDTKSKKIADSDMNAKDYINRMLGWEIVTIAILLLLVLSLLSVIFSLVARLQRMRRALKLKDFSVMEGEYHIYGELQARKVTEQMEEDKTYLEIASVSSSSGFGSDISKADRESPAAESEKEHLYGKVNKAGRENVYGKVKKADRVKDGLEGRRTDNGVRQSEEKGVETRGRVGEVSEAKEGEKNIPVREAVDKSMLLPAGRRQAKETASAVRQTKSGIFRGPAVPELERVASNLDVIDEAFASNLHPIDEALRLLQESANHL